MSFNGSIDDLAETLSLECDAFIYKNTPFDYIDVVINKFPNYNYNHSTYKRILSDFALDVYNYYVKNGVIHDAKRMALMQMTRYAIDEHEKSLYVSDV